MIIFRKSRLGTLEEILDPSGYDPSRLGSETIAHMKSMASLYNVMVRHGESDRFRVCLSWVEDAHPSNHMDTYANKLQSVEVCVHAHHLF